MSTAQGVRLDWLERDAGARNLIQMLNYLRELSIRLLKEAAWAPIGVVILHAICGELFGHEPYVDPVMHFLGGMAICYFIRRAAVLTPELIGKPSELGLDILAFGLACFAAVFWEFAEWFSDGFLGTNIQRMGGAPLRDLLMGFVGALVFLVGRRVVVKIKGETVSVHGPTELDASAPSP